MTTAWDEPLYVISVAAELAGMHPQTLRQYDRMGLVVPQRQGGRQRRYSRQDVDRLRTIQQLSREGVSLEGIRRIVALKVLSVAQLKRPEAIRRYALGVLDGIALGNGILTPSIPEDCEHNAHIYHLRTGSLEQRTALAGQEKAA